MTDLKVGPKRWVVVLHGVIGMRRESAFAQSTVLGISCFDCLKAISPSHLSSTSPA